MAQKEEIRLTEKEERLIKMIRELGFGELHIFVADSQPVRAEEIKKSVKFWPTEQQQVISQHMRYEPAFLQF